jgi:hypothetical protein
MKPTKTESPKKEHTIPISANELRKKIEYLNTLLTEKEQKEDTQSKLKIALKRFLARAKEFMEVVNDEAEEINLKHAQEDPKEKILIIKDNKYTYSKEGEIARIKEIKELWKKKYPFKPYIFDCSEEHLKTFDEIAVEELRGIFLPLINQE